ncbi:MAG: hypothetical protein ACOYBX_16340 [Mycobacterium sp.]
MARNKSSSDGGGAVVFMVFLLIWFIVKFFWWIVGALALVAAFYLVRAIVRTQQARRAVFDAYCAEVAARADQQHDWVLNGDDRGTYGPQGAALMRQISATAGGLPDMTRPESASTRRSRSAAERPRRS